MSYVRGKNGIDFRPTNTGTRNNVSSESLSGVTGETIISSVLIPADTFQAYDIVDVYSVLTKNQLGVATIRLRIGPNQTTADTLAGTSVGTGSRTQYQPFIRRFIIKNITTNTECLLSTADSNTYINSAGGTSSLSIDWTVNNYISVTAQSTTTTSIVNVEYIKIKRMDGDGK